jgi:hypothetical protein
MKHMRVLSSEELSNIKNRWVLDGDTLVWKNGINKGKPVAKSVLKSGHQNVFLRYDNKLHGYVLARVIWFLRTGEYPSLHVEHKNCNPKDNSTGNLRLASHSQNMANMSIGRTGNTKKGVYLDKRTNIFYVQVQKDGRVHSRCGFKDFESAYLCRQSLAKELFGEFAR